MCDIYIFRVLAGNLIFEKWLWKNLREQKYNYKHLLNHTYRRNIRSKMSDWKKKKKIGCWSFFLMGSSWPDHITRHSSQSPSLIWPVSCLYFAIYLLSLNIGFHLYSRHWGHLFNILPPDIVHQLYGIRNWPEQLRQALINLTQSRKSNLLAYN